MSVSSIICLYLLHKPAKIQYRNQHNPSPMLAAPSLIPTPAQRMTHYTSYTSVPVPTYTRMVSHLPSYTPLWAVTATATPTATAKAKAKATSTAVTINSKLPNCLVWNHMYHEVHILLPLNATKFVTDRYGEQDTSNLILASLPLFSLFIYITVLCLFTPTEDEIIKNKPRRRRR